MNKKYFVDELQGHRWLFKAQNNNTGKFDMVDTQQVFPDMEMSEDMAMIMAEQFNFLQEYQNDDKQDLLVPTLLLDFVRENKDIDKDIIIALINKMDIVRK